ncbi:MAG: UvrB/UvrC motif-containing protein [Planctomycetia bacterium]|nr:UvrB/UvrC motif-containing protein [Planctomycetia bacterium]
MKCQKCNRDATFHITELLGGKPEELHFCAEHAQEYLNQTQNSIPGTGNIATALASHIAQQMAFTKASNEFSQTDRERCPACGMTFLEFRSRSRLGCPKDYFSFKKQMETLLVNIHGEMQHVGKKPKRSAEVSEKISDLIHLRREMEEAVREELYEKAGTLRDQIRSLEKEAGVE